MVLSFADYLAQVHQGSPALPAAPNYSGVFGTLPGQPADTQPTVELRRLYLEMLNQQNQAAQMRAQAEQANLRGDQALAAQLAQQAAQIDIQKQQMSQQADQFSKQFGLQSTNQTFQHEMATGQFNLLKQGQEFQQGIQQGQLTGSYGGQQTLQAELGRGSLGLQRRQQAFNEEQFLAQQAADPNNLILSALSQGARTPGGALPQQQQQSQATNNYNGTGLQTQVAQPNPQGGASGSPSGQLPGSSPTLAGASSSQNPMLDQAVPVAANVANLLNRSRIPQYGQAQEGGFLTSLRNLRENANLRLRPGAMDLASLRNTTSNPNEAGYLSSTLRAQGQQPADFLGAMQHAVPKQRAALVRAN